MVRFEMSQALGRRIRADDWSELGRSSWTQALDMVRAGKVQEGLELAQYARNEMDYLRYQEARLLNMFINHIADTWGEEGVPRAWRAVGTRRAKTPTSLVKDVASYVEDAVRLTAEFQRGHNCGPTGHSVVLGGRCRGPFSAWSGWSLPGQLHGEGVLHVRQQVLSNVRQRLFYQK